MFIEKRASQLEPLEKESKAMEKKYGMAGPTKQTK